MAIKIELVSSVDFEEIDAEESASTPAGIFDGFGFQ